MRTTWGDIHDPNTERRSYVVNSQSLAPPSSIVYNITCPFCESAMRVHLWSLCGSGKRCTCGALFGSLGMAYRRKGVA